MVEITARPLPVPDIINSVIDESCGAVVSFIGTVRNESGGKEVTLLEYEAYPEMAQKKLTGICEEIKEKWGLARISIVHRIGRVKTGEAAVVIAVAAPHRKEAFEACEYAINRLKEVVPIWKKEYFREGTAWV